MNTPVPATANATAHADTSMPEANKAELLKDIHAKWDKITEAEGLALKSRDELITMVASRYGFGHDRIKAGATVDAVLKGRAFG